MYVTIDEGWNQNHLYSNSNGNPVKRIVNDLLADPQKLARFLNKTSDGKSLSYAKVILSTQPPQDFDAKQVNELLSIAYNNPFFPR